MSAIEKTYTGSAQAASGASAKLANNTSISNAAFTYAYYSGTSCSGTALSSAPKDAGSYSVKATLTGTDNYNKSTSSCVTYTMNKKAPTLSATTPQTLTYGTAKTIDYTYDGDGEVTCETSSSTYATCSVNTSTKKLTITPVKPNGSTEIGRAHV